MNITVTGATVTGRLHSRGLMLSDIRNPFFAELACGAEAAARDGNCDLALPARAEHQVNVFL